MTPNPRDLFGQVPVTLADIEIWMNTVPKHVSLSTWRRDWYIKNWNVADKIRGSKLSGEFYKP